MKTGYKIIGWLVLIGAMICVCNLPKKQKINACEQHEFVVTSEYNFFLGKYKTISKCVKCGLKVR